MAEVSSIREPRAGGPPSPSPASPRHCMVVYAYYPLGETRVQREAEALVRAGYAVDVICLRNRDEPPTGSHGGVTIHRLGVRLDKRALWRQLLSYLRFAGLAAARLTRLHRRSPYASVQVHNLPDFLVFCALVPKVQGVPVILDLHDLMPEFFASRFGPRAAPLLRLVRGQERLACRFADHVVTVSEHWRQALIARGMDAGACSVVMNVADEGIFRPSPDQPPTAVAGHRRPGFRLLYHGTVTHRYGLDLAVEAVARVRQHVPGIRLTIVGKGDGMPALFALRHRLSLERCVELRDELLPAEDLPDLISAADAGIVPYRDDVFTDGLLPTKLMEYAAMGLPCIASRTTAIGTYFRDTMVEFFTPGDVDDLARCIRALQASPERRARLARRSRHFTERHNWTTAGAAYVALVDRLRA